MKKGDSTAPRRLFPSPVSGSDGKSTAQDKKKEKKAKKERKSVESPPPSWAPKKKRSKPLPSSSSESSDDDADNDSGKGKAKQEEERSLAKRPAIKTGQVCKDQGGRWVVDFRTPGNFAMLAAHLVTVTIAMGTEAILGPVSFQSNDGKSSGEFDACTILRHAKDGAKKKDGKPPQINLPTRYLPNLLGALRHMWEEREVARLNLHSIKQLVAETESDSPTTISLVEPTDLLPTNPMVLDAQYELQVITVTQTPRPSPSSSSGNIAARETRCATIQRRESTESRCRSTPLTTCCGPRTTSAPCASAWRRRTTRRGRA